MKFLERMRRSFMVLGLVGLAAILSLAGMTFAQGSPGPVRLVLTQGTMGAFFRDGQWSIRIATLVNNTDQPRDVEVSYIGGSGPQGTETFSRIATIPPHSQRKVPFAARLEGMHLGRLVGKSFMFDIGCTLIDAKTGQLLQRNNDSGAALMVPSDLFAVCHLGVQEFGDSGIAKGLLTNVFGQYQDIMPQVANMPDRWFGYSVPNVVIVDDTSAAIMRASQIEALLDWTRHGGVLVLEGSNHLPEILHGPLGEAAGVAAVGMHKTDTLSAVSHNGKNLGSFKLAGPMPMAELCPIDAAVLYSSDSMPLLTRRALGDGWVFTLAVPVTALADTAAPPVGQATGDNGLAPILKELAEAQRIERPLNVSAFAPAGRKVLDQIGGGKGPARAVPVDILLALAAAVLIAGLAMRFKGRGELIWLVLTPFAVLLAVGLWRYSLTRSQNVRLTNVGLVSDAGGGTVRVQEGFAYAAGKEKVVKTFSAGSSGGTIRDIGKAAGVGAQVKTLTAETLLLSDQLVEPNSSRAFFVDAIVPNNGLDAVFTFGPAGLSGSVKNDLGNGLSSTMLYHNGRCYRLGDGNIPTNATVAAAITDDNFAGLNEFIFSQSGIRTGIDNARQDMILSMLPHPSAGTQVVSKPMLIGYADGSILTPVSDKNIQHQGWSLVVWPVDIVAPAPGTKVTIPSAFMDIRHAYKGMDTKNSRFPVEDLRAGTMDIKATLPPQIKQLQEPQGKLRLTLSAMSYRVTVLGLKKGGTEVALATYSDPAGPQPILDLKNMQDFQGADGSYRFRLKFEEAAGKTGELMTNKWSLKSVDLTLEGISK